MTILTGVTISRYENEFSMQFCIIAPGHIRFISKVSKVAQSCPTVCASMDQQTTMLPHPWDFPGKSNWSRLPFPSPEDLPNPGIEPRSLALQADTLLSEPPGKSYQIHNTGLKKKNKQTTTLKFLRRMRSTNGLSKAVVLFNQIASEIPCCFVPNKLKCYLTSFG